MTAPTVVVTDGTERAALAVVRSLGAAGYRCVVVSAAERSLAGASRYVTSRVAAASALAAPDAFAETVAQAVLREHADLLIPISEPSLLALLPHRARLAPCVIPFPGVESFRAISDKARVLAEASSLGIAIPAQTTIADTDGARTFDANTARFPVVVKPSRSVGESEGVRQKFGVVHAETPDALRRILDALPAAAFPVLLQQRIVGPGTGVFLLMWDGEVRASFAHRRITEKPPSGGVSVDRVSVPLDPLLLRASQNLLSRFDWTGVAMIEYKTDAATGTQYLMEINGRFWGSLQLAIDSGVDFPRVLAALSRGDAAVPQPPYRIGVRSHWFWGQIDHLIARLPRGARRSVPPGTISVPRAVADLFLGPLRSATFEEVFRWNDPRPFFLETREWLRGR